MGEIRKMGKKEKRLGRIKTGLRILKPCEFGAARNKVYIKNQKS